MTMKKGMNGGGSTTTTVVQVIPEDDVLTEIAEQETTPFQGPEPKLPPVVMLAIYSVLLAVTAGGAYNSNAVRQFLRLSGFLTAYEGDVPGLVMKSLNIFQTSDLLGGAVVGVVVDAFGPRIAQCLGYLFFCVGVYLLMFPNFMYWGFMLQGIASVTILTSCLHLGNLFPRKNRLAMSVLTGVVDISMGVYPAMVLFVKWEFLTCEKTIYVLIGLSAVGFLVTLFIIPDTPFELQTINSDALAAAAAALSDEEDEDDEDEEDDDDADEITVGKGGHHHPPHHTNKESADDTHHHHHHHAPAATDARDQWFASTDVEAAANEPLLKVVAAPGGGTSRRLQPSAAALASHRMSHMSMSVAGLRVSGAITVEDIRDLHKAPSLFMQMLCPQYLLATFVFCTSAMRGNLYFDSNEAILRTMGDVDGSKAALLETMLFASCAVTLINGFLMEGIGVLGVAAFCNTCTIAVNLLSCYNNLSIQVATFVFFLFSRASNLGILFSYILEVMGLSHFGILVGVSMVLGGLGNLFGNVAINNWVARTGPENWYWVNVGCALVGIVVYVALGLMKFLGGRPSTRKNKKH